MTRRNSAIVGVGLVVLVLGGWFFLRTQRNDVSYVGTRAAPPQIASAEPIASGATRYQVTEAGTARFFIDAPLEKIKGRSVVFRGNLDIDPSDLSKSRGEVDVDLAALKTETFGDAEKNAAQTGHSHNWLEIGLDVPAEAREQNRWARFTIGSVDSATPNRVADAPEIDGVRMVKITANGRLWLHGVMSPKTVKLTASFTGPVATPVLVHVVSDEPFGVSLKEHDIKPRDVAGKFLNGALERVGKKIDDNVQVSLDWMARPSGAMGGHLGR